MTHAATFSLFAAAMSLVVTTSTAEASEARTNVHDHRAKAVVHDHRAKAVVHDHRTKAVVHDHRTPPKNEVVVVSQGQYDCRDGAVQLYKMGFTGINVLDCDGAIYHYTAIDGSAVYKAAMSSHTAQMRLTMIGIIQN